MHYVPIYLKYFYFKMKALQWLWCSSPEKRALARVSIAGTDSPALSPPWEAQLRRQSC